MKKRIQNKSILAICFLITMLSQASTSFGMVGTYPKEETQKLVFCNFEKGTDINYTPIAK